MRVISYNILNGGEGRADPLAEVIEAQNADIIALVEADQLLVVDRIARRLKMDFIWAPTAGRGGAILSRWPIRVSVNHAVLCQNWRSAFVEAEIVSSSGELWHVVAVHLLPYASEARETERERQVDVLLERIRHLQGRPHLLMGDFNANSPIQRIDPSACKERTQAVWRDNGGQLPRRAIQRLLDAGYTDTLASIHGELAGTMGTFSTHQPGQRVDYIISAGVDPKRITGAWIETDRLATYASDHYPVGAQFSPAVP